MGWEPLPYEPHVTWRWNVNNFHMQVNGRRAHEAKFHITNVGNTSCIVCEDENDPDDIFTKKSCSPLRVSRVNMLDFASGRMNLEQLLLGAIWKNEWVGRKLQENVRQLKQRAELLRETCQACADDLYETRAISTSDAFISIRTRLERAAGVIRIVRGTQKGKTLPL